MRSTDLAWQSSVLPRYSDRLPWTTRVNSYTAALHELRRSSKPLLDLTTTNPTEVLSDYPHSQIAAALGCISDFRYQPEPFGLLSARTAICERGLKADPSQVALTASTSEAYAVLFKLLANPGDQVLIPSPSYPLFDCLAQLEAINLVPYRLLYDGSWFPDFSSLEAGVSPRTRALILVNPNNPTGSFIKRAELACLVDFAFQYDLALISDEVFADYLLAESSDRITTLNGHNDVLTFTLNGLSKSAGMPQMKLAWIGVNGPAAECREACSRLELILDTYLSVATPVQAAAQRLLSIGDEIRQRLLIRVKANLRALQLQLAGTMLQPLHTEAGWATIIRVPTVLGESEWTMRLLQDHGVVVQPGYFFDMPGEAFLVVSLLTDPAILGEGLARMLQFAKEITRS